MQPILENTTRGLFCPAGGFYVDPHQPVARAVVTHGHADHARWGCKSYLSCRDGEQVLRMRMSEDAEFEFLDYGEQVYVGGVKISLHPAGHMLGAAQIRLEYKGQIALVTGDYKLGDDPTCRSWEPVKCHLMVTESTFGLPVYRWQEQNMVYRQINDWWRASAEAGKCCVLYGYAVGKSQRLLAGLDDSIGPIYTHGAVEKGTDAYRRTGVAMPTTTYVGSIDAKDRKKKSWAGAMVVAVPSAHGTSWTRQFGSTSTAMASGWMMIRGSRRRRAVDRGFVMSDHVDWPELMTAVDQCDPETVWVTHGYSAVVARYLNECGREAIAISNRLRTEDDEEDATSETTASETMASETASSDPPRPPIDGAAQSIDGAAQ